MFVCQPVEAFHNLAGEGDKIYLLHSHFHLLVLDFAEVQYLIDKAKHAVRVTFH